MNPMGNMMGGDQVLQLMRERLQEQYGVDRKIDIGKLTKEAVGNLRSAAGLDKQVTVKKLASIDNFDSLRSMIGKVDHYFQDSRIVIIVDDMEIKFNESLLKHIEAPAGKVQVAIALTKAQRWEVDAPQEAARTVEMDVGAISDKDYEAWSSAMHQAVHHADEERQRGDQAALAGQRPVAEGRQRAERKVEGDGGAAVRRQGKRSKTSQAQQRGAQEEAHAEQAHEQAVREAYQRDDERKEQRQRDERRRL